MRQNALLRSAKGLGAPSTARKRDTKVAKMAVVSPAPVDEREAAERNEQERNDHFAVRHGVRCAGVHLIIDLHEATGLDDIDLIETTLRRCVDAAGATLLHIHLHHFQPNGGVSGVAVLAEEPHLDPHLAGSGLRGARRVHVRQGRAGALHPGPARSLRGSAGRGERAAARAEHLTHPAFVSCRRGRAPGCGCRLAWTMMELAASPKRRGILVILVDNLKAPSCPALCRASTSCFPDMAKTWKAGTSPAMTVEMWGCGHRRGIDAPIEARW